MTLRSKYRLRTLDAVRGAAVLLMLVDHVWLSCSWPGAWVIRHILTRPALPAFMMVSGYLWYRRGLSLKRQVIVIFAAVLAVRLAAWAGLPIPDILSIYAVIQLAAWLAVRWPVCVAAAGLLQSSEWRLGWPNYEPGVVLCFCCLGVLLGRSSSLPSFHCKGLEWIGRYPLSWYLGHLAALAAWRLGQ